MTKKEYCRAFPNVLFGNLILEDKTTIKLHLVTPFKKKPKSSFSLIINGLSFLKAKGMDGFILYEFVKSLNNYQSHDQNTLMEIANNISETLIEFYKFELMDNIKNRLFEMIEDIKRIVNNEKSKKIFSVVYPISYSIHYRRAFGIKLISNLDIDNLKKIYDDYSSMQKNGIVTLLYEEDFLKNKDFSEILSLKNSFYQMVNANYHLTNQKDLELYKNSGLDLVKVNIDELDKNKLPSKNIITFIKQCILVNLKVMAVINVNDDNIDYLKIIQTIHSLGVKSFEIGINDSIQNKTSLFKRLYFYLNMYHLEVSLTTDGVIKEKELKRINVNASYKENMVSWYYYNFSDNLYLDKDLLYKTGNCNMKLEECFNSSIAKKARRKKQLRVV